MSLGPARGPLVWGRGDESSRLGLRGFPWVLVPPLLGGLLFERCKYSTKCRGVKSFGGGFLGEGVWASHDQEFEGLDMGECSGGMDSPAFAGMTA